MSEPETGVVYTITIAVDDDGEMATLRVQSTAEESDLMEVALLLMDAARSVLVDMCDDSQTLQ